MPRPAQTCPSCGYRSYRRLEVCRSCRPSGRTHGIRATYQGGGCRCEPCTAAERTYRAELRRRQKETATP